MEPATTVQAHHAGEQRVLIVPVRVLRVVEPAKIVRVRVLIAVAMR